ncbi:MAG: hypothetical protein HN352_04685 [Bacteroidetes bacterium]|jgi:hypothetical protein|nr:hypothetical protein [Bacteroidota bacterium]MBT3751460.1 hypothetical protein [Bacteroidota bacterium]MBT4399897.1 hypothetical protein [Bacteroidota bacterium]MBT4410939.1 hypothetical protein [Bacteroidota bacterium]MBT5427402.1 hypothetical protein [Bacteroidota bacterium]
MDYKGIYKIFDAEKINTYPVSERTNKSKLSDLLRLEDIDEMSFDVSEEAEVNLTLLAREIIAAREKNSPVIFFTGGHLVKNGLSGLLGDLVKRGLFTMISGNAATSIHDFELALIGETSEYVPQALEKGQFGMAYEFNYINAALTLGDKNCLGYGEAVGKMICDELFRDEVVKTLNPEHASFEFMHPEISLQAICYEKKVPMTIHVGIGTDVIDQHTFFDGRAKGGCSGRDFLIYTQEISELTKGGVVLNVGSAVTGPEVFLKAASMAGNIGNIPNGIITANFDLRSYNPDDFINENTVGYYYRDQKSIVTRVPQAYGGQGYYIGGNQKQTIPLLYKKLLQLL